MAERAIAVAAERKLEVDVFDETEMAEMGLGGLLGVNRGSTEPPRIVKLTYTPPQPDRHVALVGKGVMYDSGGISLKPSDGMHVLMKMDMTGAAVVLATMSALPALRAEGQGHRLPVCTDNMPSGSAMKLGDVLTIRNGTTVEIHNTDAEGRLVLADGLSLAVEEQPDAIVDIATLTGAVASALWARRWPGCSATTRAGSSRSLGGVGRGPTSGCGSCRWPRTTASCSTPTSPT